MKAVYGKVALGLILAGGLAAVSSCGSSTSTTGGGSCTFTANSQTTCYDYTGSGFTASTGQTTCSTTTVGSTKGGSYSSSACTSSGRFAICSVNSGQATAYVLRYLTGWNTTTAQASCTTLSGSYAAN